MLRNYRQRGVFNKPAVVQCHTKKTNITFHTAKFAIMVVGADDLTLKPQYSNWTRKT